MDRERTKIGVVFSYNPAWIAGTYYVQNLVHALGRLDDNHRPVVVVACKNDQDFNYLAAETGYPYLKKRIFSDLTIFQRGINFVWRHVTGRHICFNKIDTSDLIALFPVSHALMLPLRDKKVVYWVPDFQEDYLPELFSPGELKARKSGQRLIARFARRLVLSSQDAHADFERLYPYAQCRSFVMPFAVTLPDYGSIDFSIVAQKFGIGAEKKYFFCANQFWAHKNHITVLKALKTLKDQGEKILVLFSGNTSDYRNATYYKSLTDYIEKNDLVDCVRFLGFIDRTDQLQLMKHSVAIVQPSMFEGWSTVVEDAKALGKFVILSSLGVHREQMSRNAAFFKAEDSTHLAALLAKYSAQAPSVEPYDYNADIVRFGLKFMEIAAQ